MTKFNLRFAFEDKASKLHNKVHWELCNSKFADSLVYYPAQKSKMSKRKHVVCESFLLCFFTWRATQERHALLFMIVCCSFH